MLDRRALFIIFGDVNFHFDYPCEPSTAKVIDILDVLSFSQSVVQPTHDQGHIIDWVMYRSEDDIL